LDIEDLIRAGVVDASPVVYEDFLPVSAAGVFQSNLGEGTASPYSARAEQDAFESALGATVADPFELYNRIQASSLDAVRHALGLR
jgi:uncharacterized glyoxalase superfamily metalloenzyme YdcJ